MTRDEVELFCDQIKKWTRFQSQPIAQMLMALRDHDAEQREEIESLSSLLDVANKGLLKYERQIAQLGEALEGRS